MVSVVVPTCRSRTVRVGDQRGVVWKGIDARAPRRGLNSGLAYPKVGRGTVAKGEATVNRNLRGGSAGSLAGVVGPD